MTALNLSICHPTGIQQQYMPSATMYYHRHEQKINIPQEAAPQQYRWCTNHRKSNNFSRRRISSAISGDTTTTNLLLKELAIDP